MPSVKEKILEFINNSEYKDYVLKERPLNCHSEGLPSYEIVMRTDNPYMADGMTNVFITPDTVFKAHIPYPLNFRSWGVRASFGYSNPEELLNILGKLIKKPTGCWN
ncbi:MAG TPA: hypothetical protein P5136_01420 [Methanofastidiosum sp.]|nr:hypothetical protein [Methanofastidiosum sp.]